MGQENFLPLPLSVSLTFSSALLRDSFQFPPNPLLFLSGTHSSTLFYPLHLSYPPNVRNINSPLTQRLRRSAGGGRVR